MTILFIWKDNIIFSFILLLYLIDKSWISSAFNTLPDAPESDF